MFKITVILSSAQTQLNLLAGSGNAAMMEAAMQSLSTEAADSAESSARRTARAGARREPCMLNGHSSAKVGLEPGGIGKETDVRAVRAGSTARDKRGQTLGCRSRRRVPGMATSWRVRAAPPRIRQRLWWERAAPPELKARSPIACTASSVGRRRGDAILSLF